MSRFQHFTPTPLLHEWNKGLAEIGPFRWPTDVDIEMAELQKKIVEMKNIVRV